MNKNKLIKITLEEAKEQAEKLNKQGAARFAKEAPVIQKELGLIETPLSFSHIVHIYRWLCRKQISLDMLPKKVLKEFKETKQYEKFLKESGKNSKE